MFTLSQRPNELLNRLALLFVSFLEDAVDFALLDNVKEVAFVALAENIVTRSKLLYLEAVN